MTFKEGDTNLRKVTLGRITIEEQYRRWHQPREGDAGPGNGCAAQQELTLTCERQCWMGEQLWSDIGGAVNLRKAMLSQGTVEELLWKMLCYRGKFGYTLNLGSLHIYTYMNMQFLAFGGLNTKSHHSLGLRSYPEYYRSNFFPKGEII